MAQLPAIIKYLFVSVFFKFVVRFACARLPYPPHPTPPLSPAGEKASVHVLHRRQGERMGDGVADSLH